MSRQSGQSRQSRQPSAPASLAAAREAAERGRWAKMEEDEEHWRRVNESFEAAQAARRAAGPIMGAFHCCICRTDFQRDITNDPDGSRPSPFGDTCNSCRAAGKQRPFEAAGGSVLEVLNAAAAAATKPSNAELLAAAAAASKPAAAVAAVAAVQDPVPAGAVVVQVGHAIW